MTQKLNKYAQGIACDIPLSHNNSPYLYRTIIRKDVEQMEWMLGMKEKDVAQMTDDLATIKGANISDQQFASLGKSVQLMTAKYGSVIGSPHYDEDLVLDIEERHFETECDITFITNRIASAKEAFLQLTGDVFTAKPSNKRSAQTPEQRRKLLEERKAKMVA